MDGDGKIVYRLGLEQEINVNFCTPKLRALAMALVWEL